MSESKEHYLEISHYLGDSNEFMGFSGYGDSVKLKVSLYGKKIGNYGEVGSYNSELAEAIENGFVDENGNLTDKAMLVSPTEEAVNPKGHKREMPKVDRSTAGKKPKAKTPLDTARRQWLEALDGHHAIIQINDSDIRILVADLFFKEMIGEEELESLLERNLIEKNDNDKYILTDKGRRMVHGIKAIRDLERSMSVKKQEELSAKESTENRIEQALKNIGEIDSYNIIKTSTNWYDVTLTLKSGEDLSCRVKDKTTFTEIKSKLIRLLKDYIEKMR
ncbi:MAG: hypothetical protein WC070_04165 [Candidatus Magasanikbacteria bacterium]